MNITPHFTYEELTVTNTGLPNVPSDFYLGELHRLCEEVLEPTREITGPLHVNSGFRTPEVNEAIPGHALHSQHMDGNAADVVPLNMTLADAFYAVKISKVPYDQLILEPSWIHISCSPKTRGPRRQTLRMHRDTEGRPRYEAF